MNAKGQLVNGGCGGARTARESRRCQTSRTCPASPTSSAGTPLDRRCRRRPDPSPQCQRLEAFVSAPVRNGVGGLLEGRNSDASKLVAVYVLDELVLLGVDDVCGDAADESRADDDCDQRVEDAEGAAGLCRE